jgi:phosphatidylserine decarboxylase
MQQYSGARHMAAWLSGLVRIAPEGLVFIFPLAGLTLLGALLGWWGLTIVGGGLTGCVAFFFRDPERVVPQAPEIIVSPADGRVMETRAGDADTCRVSIFLSILNVHVNRAPYGGTVSKVVYTPGQFLAAYRQEASLVNEANSVAIQSHHREFIVKQIAGVIARRIVCRVQPGEVLEKGQRYGLIRFGSRVDVILPQDAEVMVQVGDIVKGGETILAVLKEPPDV